MTSADDVRALLARVEAATEPDRRLEVDILVAIGGYSVGRRSGKERKDWLYNPEGYREELSSWGASRSSRVTQSIDAALALVERDGSEHSQAMNDAIEAMSSGGWRGGWSAALPRWIVIAHLRNRLAQLEPSHAE